MNIGEKLIAENKGFSIYFDCSKQLYNVYKDGKFLIGEKYKFSDVKPYLN